MEEIWKKINGYTNYEVSNLGRVKNISRQKYLKPRINDKGYYGVMLYNNASPKNHRIHRLVLCTFDNIDYSNELECNHKDEDKINNKLDNLNWLTKKENMNWNNLTVRIKRNPITKPIKRICVVTGSSVDYRSATLASKDGFCRKSVIECLKNRRKDYKGYNWEYIFFKP